LGYTQEELAEAARISISHYFNLKKAGKGARETVLGRRRIITVPDAEQWLASLAENAKTPAEEVA
jgi:hypothetical protein